MNISEINDKLKNGKEYEWFRNHDRNKDIILLGLGGSHAYGTNNENSDLDIRGIATNKPNDILLGRDFETVINKETDTVIYSLRKIVSLLKTCNPNTIELLGLKPEHYLFLNDYGRTLLDNKNLFLSKICISSFGGYANAQLRRLSNKSIRDTEQSKREEYILKSIEHAKFNFAEKFDENEFKLYIDESDNEDFDTEIFVDVNVTHKPFRNFFKFLNENHSVITSYDKIGKRNKNAFLHDKIGKHMMHLVRLYLMCFDILEKGEIITYREKDHDFLMSIRNGEYIDKENQVKEEFFKIVDDYETKLQILSLTTKLPDKPNYDAIDKMMLNIYEDLLENKRRNDEN